MIIGLTFDLSTAAHFAWEDFPKVISVEIELKSRSKIMLHADTEIQNPVISIDEITNVCGWYVIGFVETGYQLYYDSWKPEEDLFQGRIVEQGKGKRICHRRLDVGTALQKWEKIGKV